MNIHSMVSLVATARDVQWLQRCLSNVVPLDSLGSSEHHVPTGRCTRNGHMVSCRCPCDHYALDCCDLHTDRSTRVEHAVMTTFDPKFDPNAGERWCTSCHFEPSKWPISSLLAYTC
jgi:hypothetical protein